MSTIRDVAKLANVSTATVSRVLNNDTKYKITDETRERVWQAVTRLNYKITSSPKRKVVTTEHSDSKSHIKIGCVLSVTKDKYNDPYFMSILSGVEERLLSAGYNISFIRTGIELNDSKILFHTFSEPITGLILMESLNGETYEYIRKQVPYIVGLIPNAGILIMWAMIITMSLRWPSTISLTKVTPGLDTSGKRINE